MKRTYTVSIWNGGHMSTRILTHIKVTAIDVNQALDKAETKARTLNRSGLKDSKLKADYLLCSGFFRLVV